MKIIVCLGERGGMSFNGRRQSRDRAVIADILSYAEGALTVSPRTAKLFPEGTVSVMEDPLEARDGYVFVELGGIARALERVDEIIIYRWNVLYPMDECFDVEPAAEGFRLEGCSEFAGYTHEKITKEIYIR